MRPQSPGVPATQDQTLSEVLKPLSPHFSQIVSSGTLTLPLMLKPGKPAGRGTITVRNEPWMGSSL